ncbi:MAG: hypothetical protein RIS52_2282 [Pseudomonadota bacterium]
MPIRVTKRSRFDRVKFGLRALAVLAFLGASSVSAQNQSDSYEQEAMAYISQGQAAEAGGDYASACQLYGLAWGKFDWVEDALLEESRMTVSVDSYGNPTEDTGLQRNLQATHRNSRRAYDLKAAACAKAGDVATQGQPAVPTGNLKRATDWMQLGIQQFDAGKTVEACATMRKSETLFVLLLDGYTQANASPEVIKLLAQNVEITGETIPNTMHCPRLPKEETFLFAINKFQELTNETFNTYMKAEKIRSDGNMKEACRLYKSAKATADEAYTWHERSRVADGHEAAEADMFEKKTAIANENVRDTTEKVQQCIKLGL